MSVRKKPKGGVEDFIVSAAVEQATAPSSSKNTQVVTLRVDSALLAEIDGAVNVRRPAPSRHQWILEAICEKLERSRTSG